MTSEKQGFADKLKTARRVAVAAENPVMAAKEGVKAAVNLAKLATYIDPMMDWLFAIALIFAIIKDALDLVDTALVAIGGVGVALIFVTTAICSLAIFFIMLLVGSSGKSKALKGLAKRLGALAGATIVECIPGIDALPLETIGVIIIIWMTLVDRQKAAQEEKQKQAPTNALPA